MRKLIAVLMLFVLLTVSVLSNAELTSSVESEHKEQPVQNWYDSMIEQKRSETNNAIVDYWVKTAGIEEHLDVMND